MRDEEFRVDACGFEQFGVHRIPGHRADDTIESPGAVPLGRALIKHGICSSSDALRLWRGLALRGAARA